MHSLDVFDVFDCTSSTIVGKALCITRPDLGPGCTHVCKPRIARKNNKNFEIDKLKREVSHRSQHGLLGRTFGGVEEVT